MHKRSRSAVSGKRRSSPAQKASSKSQAISARKKARRVPALQLSERSFSARQRSQHALRDMRRGASMSNAAHDNGVSIPTLKKYVGSALVQERPGGRVRATKSDRFVRYLQLPGLQGPVFADTRSWKEAQQAARYKWDVNRVLAGDLNATERWKGKKIAGIELITAPETLKGLAQDELLPYSLYRSLSGGTA